MKFASIATLTFTLAAGTLGCSSSDSTNSPDGGSGGSANAGGTGGTGGSANAGGSGGTNQGGTGGSGGADMGGAAGEGGTPGNACEDAERLPAGIDEDMTVGPGCVILDQTVVGSDAELTIVPGTTVRVELGGYLSVSRGMTAPDDGGTLTARGTADDPIVFTSLAEDPLPGDWGCILLGDDAAASRLEHVTLEYGGGPCGATGNGFEAELVVAGQTRSISEVTTQHSSRHGMMILLDGLVQTFENNHFADNAAASLKVAATQLVTIGTGNTFQAADDTIEVDGTGMNRDGNIRRQPVPYRFLEGPAVGTAGAQPEITVEAGVRFELESDSFAVQAGNLIIDGTADDPVVFSSAKESPAPGDWGCLWYHHGATNSQNTGTPTLRHAHFEFAGDDTCGNNNDWPAALVVTQDADLTGLSFENIAGHAILVSLDECPANACDQEFTDLDAEPLYCDGAPRSCP